MTLYADQGLEKTTTNVISKKVAVKLTIKATK
jgi:hypothetical protein